MEEPSQPDSPTWFRWLVSDEAAHWLDWLRAQDLKRMATLARLREELSPEQVAGLLELTELRERGKRKFAAADRMFFTKLGLQQATDEGIAAYKAARFPAAGNLADMCCGIGGDLMALARRAPTTAVDTSAEHLCFAEANVRAHGGSLAQVVHGLAEETPLEEFSAWHIDPDRRPTNQRTVRLEGFRPALDTLQSMLARNPNAAFKLAPASEIPPGWQAAGQCEWISHHRECKQLMVWLGSLSEEPGSCRATKLSGEGQIDHFTGMPATRQVKAAQVQAYLLDPDPSLVVSGLLDTLAESLGLARVSPQSQYLTSEQPIEHPLLQTFEVLVQEKIDSKQLKRAVADAGWAALELKQRGLELNLPKLRKQLKPRGAGEGTIVFTPTTEGNRAIFCRRLAS